MTSVGEQRVAARRTESEGPLAGVRRDGRWMVIAANSDNLWPRLAQAMERPELAGDARFATHDARSRHEDELDEIIGAWAAERDAARIDAVLDAAGVVCGPVPTIADVFADEHVQARGMLVPVHDEELGEIRGPGVFPKLSRTPGRQEFRSSWTAGADTAAVLGELLGLDERACDALAGEGII